MASFLARHFSIFAGGHLGETLRYLAHLGVLFLVFVAGLEVDLEAMRRAGSPPRWRAPCIGDLNAHHTGTLFVVPVVRVLGLERK